MKTTIKKNRKQLINKRLRFFLKWSHLGSNQGHPDYESENYL
jgi:hypothetical protein